MFVQRPTEDIWYVFTRSNREHLVRVYTFQPETYGLCVHLPTRDIWYVFTPSNRRYLVLSYAFQSGTSGMCVHHPTGDIWCVHLPTGDIYVYTFQRIRSRWALCCYTGNNLHVIVTLFRIVSAVTIVKSSAACNPQTHGRARFRYRNVNEAFGIICAQVINSVFDGSCYLYVVPIAFGGGIWSSFIRSIWFDSFNSYDHQCATFLSLRISHNWTIDCRDEFSRWHSSGHKYLLQTCSERNIVEDHLDVENDTQNFTRHDVPNWYVFDVACVYGAYNERYHLQSTGHEIQRAV